MRDSGRLREYTGPIVILAVFLIMLTGSLAAAVVAASPRSRVAEPPLEHRALVDGALRHLS